MKKYLVDIYLPSINQHYNACLPVNKSIAEVTGLLVEIAEKLSDNGFIQTPDTMLMDADTGEPLDPNTTVYYAGIRNASHLILI